MTRIAETDIYRDGILIVASGDEIQDDVLAWLEPSGKKPKQVEQEPITAPTPAITEPDDDKE